MDLQNQGGEQNLDSLLDTMANAVGIFVVVMAVAQITVSQAVRRLRDTEALPPPIEAETSPEHLAELELRWAETAPRQWESERELDRLQEKLQQQPAIAPDAPQRSSRAAALNAAALAASALESRELAQEIEEKRQKLAALRIRMSDESAEGEAAVTSVRLPDPRPAPAHSTRRTFACRYGRVVQLDFDGLKQQLTDTMRQTMGASPLLRNSSISLAQVARYFERTDVGNDRFRWTLRDRGRVGLMARLDWRSQETGNTWRQLQRRSAEYHEALRSSSPTRHHVHFFVWGDSFLVYLEARRLAEEAGFSAGWTAFEEESDLDLVFRMGPVPDDTPLPID
jgi:hypothetical protein